MLEPLNPDDSPRSKFERVIMPAISPEDRTRYLNQHYKAALEKSGGAQIVPPLDFSKEIAELVSRLPIRTLPLLSHNVIAEQLGWHTDSRRGFRNVAEAFVGLAQKVSSVEDWGSIHSLLKQEQGLAENAALCRFVEGLTRFIPAISADASPECRRAIVLEFQMPWDTITYSERILEHVAGLATAGVDPYLSIGVIRTILKLERTSVGSDDVSDVGLESVLSDFLECYGIYRGERPAYDLHEAFLGIRDFAPQLHHSGVSPFLVPPSAARLLHELESQEHPDHSSQLLSRVLAAHTHRLLEEGLSAHDIREEIANAYAQATDTITNFEMHRVLGALNSEKLLTPQDIHGILNNASMDRDLIRVIQEARPEQTSPLLEGYSQATTGDQVPYGTDSQAEEAQRCFDQVLQVYRRLFDLHRGFSALTFDGKRLPGREGSTLARFGLDSAGAVEILNSLSSDTFPGRGVVLQGLLLSRLFDMGGHEGDMPFRDLKERVLPWARAEIDIIGKTRFIFARGLIVVSAPKGSGFTINDAHYSYVVPNDHFFPSLGSGFLAPTRFFDQALINSTLDFRDFTGFRTDKPDLTAGAFSLEELTRFCALARAPLLNLGWGSNLGGLCNAFPPDSHILHDWEAPLRQGGATTDFWGHVHKSYITGRYQNKMNPEQDQALAPLRRAHNLVYRITTSYQNLIDLFRIGLAQWHKGATPLDGAEMSKRMLHEAYRWHLEGTEARLPRTSFPVLCEASTLDYTSVPSAGFYLDTHDMTLHQRDREVLWLSRSKPTDLEDAVWEREVLPHIGSLEKDLRFYDRRELGLE